MKIPRDVSGLAARRCLVPILETSEPTQHRISIPDHDPLRLGTFGSILRKVAQHKGVPRDAIIASL